MIMRSLIFTFVFLTNLSLLLYSSADAGNFGFGVHSGYGIIKFEEKENNLGTNFESESEQNAFLFGGSGEYSFKKPKNFFAGITTDWAFGLTDTETWTEEGAQFQTNDIKFFGQFYDLRFGYKNSLDKLYYRIYVSGGWDGLHFKRDEINRRGARIPGDITEDIRLWRTGVGAGFGYRIREWAIDGRVAYSYYPAGETEDSSLPQLTFDTDGTCLDVGLGVARGIRDNLSFYIGGSYTLQKLDGDTADNNPSQDISWETKLEILVGMVNLTYAF